MRRKASSLFGLALFGSAVWLFAFAEPAGAVIDGPCTASGTWVNGLDDGGSFTVDANTDEVITVPLKDQVRWKGSIAIPPNERLTDGNVAIDLPWPFGKVTVESWGKSGDGKTSKGVSNEGVEEYELPSIIPRGVEIDVTGTHIDEGATCTFKLKVKVEGSAGDSWLLYPSLAATVVSLVGVGFAARPKFKKVWVQHS